MITGKMTLLTAACGLLLTLAAHGQTSTGNVTWSGGGGNPNWNESANWAGNAAPANPTPGIITFGDAGQAIMSVLDADRTVNALYAGFKSSAAGYTCTHTFDLGGRVLTITNLLQGVSGYQSRRNTLNFTNGTVRIGTATGPGNLTVNSLGSLCFKPGSQLDLVNLHTLKLVANAYGTTEMDLRGATLGGGKLQMRQLYMNGGGWFATRMLMDDATAINAIEVTEIFEMGKANTSGNTPQYIGNPADTFIMDSATFGKLPAGISLTIGTSVTTRANMLLVEQSHNGGNNRAAIRAASGGGGSFTAYLSSLKIGMRAGANPVRPRALLDVSAMDACTLDVLDVQIAPGRSGAPATDDDQGELRLPQGSATVGTAVIGATAGVGFGRLALSNTVFTVTNAFTLNKTAQVTISIDDESKGLTIKQGFADGGGTLNVNFLTQPSAGSTNWAIRIAGDAASTLNAMIGQGRLTHTIATSITGKKTGVVSDGSYTYFALVDDSTVFDPIALAKNTTFEIGPDNRVTVAASEVDNGSINPDALETPVQLMLVYNGAPQTNQLVFTSIGSYPVTLVANILDGQGEVIAAATAAATVTVVALPSGTQESVEWSGGAATVLMPERREWFWSDNWLGKEPPANPTTGTIIYQTLGQNVRGCLTTDRTVSSLQAGQSGHATDHTLDMGGKNLIINDQLLLIASATTRFSFTNGMVQLGMGTAAANLNIFGHGTVTLRPGTKLSSVNLNEIYLSGTEWASTPILDLRGSEIVGGILTTRKLLMPATSHYGSRIYLDATTVIETLAVAETFELGCGNINNDYVQYIGDPADTFIIAGKTLGRLPAGVSITVGVDETARAEMVIVRAGHSGGVTMAAIKAAPGGGGTFTAYLTALQIGMRSGTLDVRLPYGMLDLAAIDRCLVDTQTLEIAPGRGVETLESDNERGVLRLPAGEAVIGTALIGAPAGIGFGLMETSNTFVTVTDTLTLQQTAIVTNMIGAVSSGFAITNMADSALKVAAGARLTLRFLEPATSRPHTGLRWAGNHRAVLEEMILDGRLIIDDAGLAREAAVFVSGNQTMIGLPPAGGTVLLLW